MKGANVRKLARTLIESAEKWGDMAVFCMIDFAHYIPDVGLAQIMGFQKAAIATKNIEIYKTFAKAAEKANVNKFVDAIIADEEMDAYDLLDFVLEFDSSKIYWSTVVPEIVASGDVELMLKAAEVLNIDIIYKDKVIEGAANALAEKGDVQGLKDLAEKFDKNSSTRYLICEKTADALLAAGNMEELEKFLNEIELPGLKFQVEMKMRDAQIKAPATPDEPEDESHN